MAFMRIHCETCGGSWEIYSRESYDNENSRICPHCYAEIPGETWRKFILPAFVTANDADKKIMKDDEYGRPVFFFDIISDRLAIKCNLRRCPDDE